MVFTKNIIWFISIIHFIPFLVWVSRVIKITYSISTFANRNILIFVHGRPQLGITIIMELSHIQFAGDGFPVLLAQTFRKSINHIASFSHLISGDSGGAVVFSRSGKVIDGQEVILHVGKRGRVHQWCDWEIFTGISPALSYDSRNHFPVTAVLQTLTAE